MDDQGILIEIFYKSKNFIQDINFKSKNYILINLIKKININKGKKSFPKL
jgi:hypothetical protein